MINKLTTSSTLLLAACSSIILAGCNQANNNEQQAADNKLSATASSEQLTFFVSPDGKAGNMGSKASPFKTLKEARDAIRQLDTKQRDQDITVWLRGGTHTLKDTLVLNRQDGGKGEHFIHYRAYKDETPVISSGKSVDGWKLLDSPLDGLPDIAKGKVWVSDVSREEYGRFTALFTKDKRLPRARSERFDGEKPTGYEIADSRNVMHKKDRHLLKKITYKTGAPIRNWSNLDDIEVFFNPVPWALNFIPLESIDLDKQLLNLKYEANAPAFSQDSPWAVIENAVDFIDEAGEWAHNSETGKLYYWPHDNKKPTDITIPQLKELVRVEGEIDYDGPVDQPVKNISFEGITFTKAKRATWYKGRKGWGIQHDWDTFDTGNAMLRFRGAENMLVKGNHFTNSAGSAMRLDLHAQNITIKDNLIDYVGHMGILLAGYGPGTKDVNHHNTITNNIIHHVGEIIWHGHAIFAWQSGSNTISNNWIHHVPRKAVGVAGPRVQILMKKHEDFDEAAKTIRWNELDLDVEWSDDTQAHFMPYLHAKNNIIENNKVTKTLLQLHDGASINVSGAGEGNIIRHNYIFDVDYIGTRTDDWQRGTITTQNIIENAGTGIVHKDYNHITNNLFININGEAIRMRAFPRQYFKPESIIEKNIFTKGRRPPYGSRNLWNTKEFFATKKGTKLIPYEYILDNNTYAFEGAEKFLAKHQKHGVEQNSIATEMQQFVDIENKDFRLVDNAAALKSGFIPFDVSMDSFGVSKDYPEHLLKLDRDTMQWGGETLLHGGLEGVQKNVH
ncbi:MULTISPECIES: right-handed parallel beta-helix repeat-containing protein [unclassified Pseudoalteromonas]|uniref:right-handed parallel beta-helix repeat-containing protein n=1 Tax=unclassified Pseudoalteromonas TaxID=194690 RepID=UPI000693F03E|nr:MULTISPECIES: right-handed parallel beta-helix repeat-containing protein [unclassified Pseudoalteromonas]